MKTAAKKAKTGLEEPTQVKSASVNRGTFDPTDPDIRHNPKRLDYGKYAGEANGLSFIVRQAGQHWAVRFYSPRMVAKVGLEHGIPFYEAQDTFRTKREAVAAAVDLATDPVYGLIKRAASSDSYYFDYPEGRETLAHIVEAAKRYMHRNPSQRTFIPPKAVADQARMGLALRDSLPPSQRCCTSVGLRRAVQLANRQPVSVRTLKRMRSYFQRHAVDSRGIGWRETSKGWQAWLCWGSDAGRKWCNEILDTLGE